MSTLKQACNRKTKTTRPGKKYINPVTPSSRTPILKRCPQVKGIVTKVVTMSPKKPNSAIRHVAKVDLTSGLRLTARLPGKGYLCGKYSRVLIEGGRANDLPGVGYTVIRGVYDFSAVVGKIKRRSVYGVSRPSGHSKHIRRSVRN
jgi:small subunit ribosomal protein S12